MKLQNPFLHYPKYIARIILVDGGAIVQNGVSYPEIEILSNKEDIAAICLAAIQANGECMGMAMHYDGGWHEYDEELANQLECSTKSLPEPEPCMCPLTTEETKEESMVSKSQEKSKKALSQSESADMASETPVAEYESIEDEIEEEWVDE